MNQVHKQLMDTLVRVRSFTDANPVQGSPSFASARAMLDDVVQRLRDHAQAQVTGQELRRAEVKRQKEQMSVLIDHHIRPIVAIARSQIAPQSDVGLPTALRMPRLPLSPTKMLAACDGMVEAARAFEAVFVANGLAPDFLAQLTAARDTLERVMGGKATQVSAHMAASAGLEAEIIRGRRALERMDAVVRGAFRGDFGLLRAWRGAKRLQYKPGTSGPRAAASEVAPVSPATPAATPVAAPVAAPVLAEAA